MECLLISSFIIVVQKLEFLFIILPQCSIFYQVLLFFFNQVVVIDLQLHHLIDFIFSLNSFLYHLLLIIIKQLIQHHLESFIFQNDNIFNVYSCHLKIFNRLSSFLIIIQDNYTTKLNLLYHFQKLLIRNSISFMNVIKIK